MSNPAERIQAALLRFRDPMPASEGRQVSLGQPQETAGQPVVVVNEQNLAALASSIVDLPYPKGPRPKLAALKRE